MAGKKKTFIGQDNPAMQFISTPAPEGEEPVQGGESIQEVPKGFKPDPRFVETKSRRVQLLMQPSLHEALKARAKHEGQSVNELVHSLLDAALKKGEAGHE